MDECGRGPLAGPLVAAAVILKKPVSGLNDSKKLNADKRDMLYEQIVGSGAIIQVVIVSTRIINRRGIGWANTHAFRTLVRRMDAHKYLVDGNLKLGIIKGKTKKIRMIVGGDACRKSIMAASIVAKVTRDRLMRNLHTAFPNYGWENNAGYGTHFHVQAIRKFGVTRHHRTLFVTTALKHAHQTSDGS